jgi:hypothetical protein
MMKCVPFLNFEKSGRTSTIYNLRKNYQCVLIFKLRRRSSGRLRITLNRKTKICVFLTSKNVEEFSILFVINVFVSLNSAGELLHTKND